MHLTVTSLPVPVSELVDDRTGEPVDIQANQIPKTIKKETTIERGNPLCSDSSEIPVGPKRQIANLETIIDMQSWCRI